MTARQCQCGAELPYGGRGRPQVKCRTCRRDDIAAKQRAYYEANRDDIAAKQRAYREANRDDIAAKQRARKGLLCGVCGESLRRPSPDRMCGFCREEAA